MKNDARLDMVLKRDSIEYRITKAMATRERNNTHD